MPANPDRPHHRGQPRRRGRDIGEVAVAVSLVLLLLLVSAVVRDQSDRLIGRLPSPVVVTVFAALAVGYIAVLVRRRRRRSRLARGSTLS